MPVKLAAFARHFGPKWDAMSLDSYRLLQCQNVYGSPLGGTGPLAQFAVPCTVPIIAIGVTEG